MGRLLCTQVLFQELYFSIATSYYRDSISGPPTRDISQVSISYARGGGYVKQQTAFTDGATSKIAGHFCSSSLVPRLYPCARTQTDQKCNEVTLTLTSLSLHFWLLRFWLLGAQLSLRYGDCWCDRLNCHFNCLLYVVVVFICAEPVSACVFPFKYLCIVVFCG